MHRKYGYGFVFACVFFTVFVFASVAFGARSLYDDFSSGLTEYKFDAGPVQREISSGVLMSGLARRATDNGFRKNRLPFANPDTISTIQAEVRVDSTNATQVENVAAELEGVFYQAANGQQIWAGVLIGDQGSGLKAWWAISGINADGSIDSLYWNDLWDVGYLSNGTFYTTKISYDSGTNTFTFEVSGVSEPFTPAGDYARAGDPASPMRSLTTVIKDTLDQSAGSVFARFDNVYVNNVAYDDFSISPLDPAKWWNWEIARLIANPLGNNDLVRLDIRSVGGMIQSNTLPLQYDNTPYLEAIIVVNSNTNMAADSMGRARIGGYYYNQSRGFGSGQPYNGREGDVFVQAGLQTYFEGETLKVKAVCKADVSNVDETSYTPVFDQVFATNVGFDTPHNFSILFTGTALTCSYDGVPFTYNIASPVYESSESTRMLSSRVQPPTNGYLHAMYDDVYVNYETITGTVVNESNVPVPGVAVSFWNEMEVGGGTATGEDGAFTLNNVMPGGLGFRLMPDVSTGLAWYQDEFFLNPGQSLNLGTIRLKQGALVSGVLQCVDDPESPYPVEDMELWYGGKFELGYLVTAAGGESPGYFEFRLPVGQYRLNIDEDDLFTMVPLQINITDVNQTDYENITLDAYDWNGHTIDGNVSIGVAYTGQAAVITFMGNEQFSPETWGGLSTLKETAPGPSGDYFLIVPPTPARLGQQVIVALGTAVEGPDNTESFTVLTSQLVDTPATGVNFSWETTTYKVEGFVKDGASNDPVYHSQVLLYKVGTPDQFAGYAETDRNGRYTIYNVAAGTYKLAAISRDYPQETVSSAPFTLSGDKTVPDIFMGDEEEKIQGDFNGDGQTDILFYNTQTSQVQVWLMNGVTRIGRGYPGTPGLEWAIVDVADFNGDTKSDILFYNTQTSQLQVWLMNGVTRIGRGYPGTPGLEWGVVRASQLDNLDNKADILLRNDQTGQLQVWRMDGLTRIQRGYPGTSGLEWQIVSIADFNGDGTSDVLFYNTQTTQLEIWLINGVTRIGRGNPGTAGAEWKVVDTEDFNGDTKSDILLYNTQTTQLQVWLINGVTRIGRGYPGTAGAEWNVVGAEKFNADTSSDVLLRNMQTGQLQVWLINGVTRIGRGYPGTDALEWEIQ